MIEAFWVPLLPPYLIGLVLSWVVETLLTPRPVAPWRRPAAAIGVHVGVWTLAFALELALFRRPYFGVFNVLAVQLLIVLVSNAKYRALREPFVYPDFEYFTDAIRHPRLYLPFFGVTRALAAGGGYGAALWAGLVLEDSVTAGAGIWLVSFAELPQEHMFDPTAPMVPFFVHALGLAMAGIALAAFAGMRNTVCLDASVDLRRLGLVAALWSYGLCERQTADDLRASAPFSGARLPEVLPDPMPDLVAIQSESFFDARRAYSKLLRADILANFDLLKSEAVAHGQLKVAAWGANTVRTEFAFLAGMEQGDLGIHQYNPYRRLAKRGFPTIASYLKSLGYRTVCVHPYHRGFYGRNEVLPALGFDEFIGGEAFAALPKDGPYVGDRALADFVNGILQGSERPLYVHVITMENHGPLHWETVSETDVGDVLTGRMPKECEELVSYARHLRNADAMFGMVRDALIKRRRPASLCIFGDHVPIMPNVYRALGELEGTTDYVLWQTAVRAGAPVQPEQVSALSRLWLRTSGLLTVRTTEKNQARPSEAPGNPRMSCMES
ncbi:LTA synthase family protein [Achromobacter sp. NFACC18-2]|uniref:LTA synthase family protein n=1 Tax=Achromobacter sp. NFACC18-2 TaxID=1564112 RepID=UPI0008AF66E7|nr:LTA synthase family protein [Achromobacter sp. NFACC18-2]SEI43179.1 Phosphoglycerol transferase MdoB [Achromobacter sp. NFACC18-2]